MVANTAPPAPLSASDFYARAHGRQNEGKEKCHWCGSACSRQWVHDDVPRQLFIKSKEEPRYPGEPWMCFGCYTFRRKRLTIQFLDGFQQDIQCPMEHSWLIRPGSALAIRRINYGPLYDFLLKPSVPFLLMLSSGPPVWLHKAVLNAPAETTAGTPLHYTLDNRPQAYSVYELEQALRHGTAGKEPGVRLLVELLGPKQLPPLPEPPERGRPPVLDPAVKVLKKKV